MKLLGVEFSEFACFERQFVPIRPGMNLLVGPNNAGKTALLRGLSALHALPIYDPPRNAPASLGGYFRGGNAKLSFDLVSELENSDRALFKDMPEEFWDRIRTEGLARWTFSSDQSGKVSFAQCAIAVPNTRDSSKPIILTIIRGPGPDRVTVTRFSSPTYDEAGQAQIGLKAFAPGAPPIALFGPENRVTAPLRSLGNVKLISPHRVVQNRNQLQTVLELPSDAQSLPPFLMTLQGHDRDAFEKIEKFVTSVFPEFKYVNAVSTPNNQLHIDLTEALTDRRIPLENCGTGVEQILTLATFILTTPKPGLVLLDEPHSYLHPTAERALVQFLEKHSEHSYVISTHSAVLINSVTPDRITYVRPPGRPYARASEPSDTPRILFDLGYRNSDALFSDRLVLVEGPSDKKILPLLLAKDGEIDEGHLNHTGFPVLEGAPRGSSALQTCILRYERLLGSIGRGDQPRAYIFDGDRKDDEKEVLRGTTSPITGEQISACFLPRIEIENYLLVPEAISAAIREELRLKGELREVLEQDVKAALDELLQSKEERLFAQGKKAGGAVLAEIKGSRALERIYEKYGLSFHKEKSGVLIAKYISAKNQPALTEVADLVRPLFKKK